MKSFLSTPSFLLSFCVIFAVSVFATGCDDGPASIDREAEPTTPLAVETQSDDALIGSFTKHGVTVGFDSRVDGETYSLSISLDGSPIDITANPARQEFSMDGHDYVISATESQVLEALVPALRSVLPSDAPDHHSLVARMTDFLSKSPKGMEIGSHTHTPSAGKGIQCLTLHTNVNAVYTSYNSVKVYNWIEVGDDFGFQEDGDEYDCMGQCGTSCENTQGGWCMDCMNHDWCSWDQDAGYSFADPACGGEWWAASDDYSFGGHCTG